MYVIHLLIFVIVIKIIIQKQWMKKINAIQNAYDFKIDQSIIGFPIQFIHSQLYIQYIHSYDNLVIFSIFLLFMLWSLFFKGILLYLRAVYTFGYRNVGYVFLPLTTFRTYQTNNTNQYGNSYEPFVEIVRKNPETKVIVYQTLFVSLMFLIDLDLIKDSTIEIVQKVQKPRRLLFLYYFFTGIFSQEGDQWRQSRKLLANLFHFESLRLRQEITSHAIFKYTKNLEQNKINCFQVSRKIISESLIQSLVGKEFFDIQFEGHNFFEEISYLMNIILDETRKPWNIIRTEVFKIKIKPQFWTTTKSEIKLFERMKAFKILTMNFIKKQREKFLNGEKMAPFLTNYFKLEKYDDIFSDIFMQIMNLFFAGVDSTTTALTFCLYQLAENPKIQAQLRIQIQQHLKKGQDIHNCKGLNNFIQETLRMNPPVPTLLIRVLQQKVEIGVKNNKFRLFKNDWISAGIFIAMENPKYFQQPQKFYPDRFLKPVDKIFSYIPFSAGPRNCIGQHLANIMLRISIKEIILKYKLSRTDEEFKQLAGDFVLNRPLHRNLVTFNKLNDE